MKAKAAKGIAIVLILLAICALAGYHLSYPIKLDTAALPGHIKDFYNRGRSVEFSPTITVYDGVGIGKNEYYLNLIELGGALGSVTLEKGLTGRYKFTSLSYGSGNFLTGIIESGGKKYLLLGGRDITRQISKITVLIEGQVYELHTEAKDHFLLCAEIDHRPEDCLVDRNYISFYNEKGEDITELYNLSGGVIQ